MMRSRPHALPLFLGLALFAAPLAAAKAGPKAKPRRAAPRAQPFETDLLDWGKLPFSDYSSHGVLLRQPQGLGAWRLRSSFAFGSQAAVPNPAKDLFDLRLEWKVEGEVAPRFAPSAASGQVSRPVLTSYPRWVQEEATDGDLKAELTTVFAGTDAVVAACTLSNKGSKLLRVRPFLRLSRAALGGYKVQVEASPRFPAFWLGLDRGALAGRPLQEWAGVWMGAQAWRLEAEPAFLQGGGAEPLSLSRGASARQEGGLGLSLTWTLPQRLGPGQSLRLPFLLAWGREKAAVQALAQKTWVESARPAGTAWKQAQKRWALTRSHLPQAVEARWQPLLKRAVLALIVDDYAARGAMNANLASADKGQRDAFYGVEAAVAALGWAELDMERAEAALLELSSFAAAAPAPLPPYTGEEKLAWEAAGLPLHGLAAWELYHRDPDVNRAARFLGGLGPRLRNECAWWPDARDGDGNGLYAFSRDEEKPALFRLEQPSPAAGAPAGLSQTGQDSGGAPSFQPYSVALSSLLAWQQQAAAALAGAAGQSKEAEGLMARSEKTRGALLAQAWDAGAGRYGADSQASWPWILGLDRDANRAQAAIPKLLQDLREQANGTQAWAPWQRYYQLRGLAAWGYLAEAGNAAAQTLESLQKRPGFCSICREGGQDEGILDSASAAVALALSLGRHEQEIFLTEKTGPFEARWLQFRALDGSFYMKRTRIPEKKAPYSKILVETLKNGPILSEKSFIFSSDAAMTFQIQSESPMNIALAKSPSKLIFNASKRVELLVPAKTRYFVQFLPVK